MSVFDDDIDMGYLFERHNLLDYGYGELGM
jgi:hypothetical protein